jgi:hypothetical protein
MDRRVCNISCCFGYVHIDEFLFGNVAIAIGIEYLKRLIRSGVNMEKKVV